jgi:hypothetical protein
VPADQAAPLTAYQPKLPTYSSVNNDLSAYGDKDRDVKPASGVRGGGTARFTVAPAPTAGGSTAAAAGATAATEAPAVSTTIVALDLDLRRVAFTTGRLFIKSIKLYKKMVNSLVIDFYLHIFHD